MKNGLCSKAVHYVLHLSGSKESIHFVWKISESYTETELINKCNNVIHNVGSEAPIYERRITKKAFRHAYGFITSGFVARSMFRELTDDKSMPLNLSEEEIEKRFQYSLRCEDTSIIADLRNQPQGDKEGRFNDFFCRNRKNCWSGMS